jgi:hypothetical protein
MLNVEVGKRRKILNEELKMKNREIKKEERNVEY